MNKTKGCLIANFATVPIAEQNLIAAIELDERIGCSASLLFSLSFISVQVHDNIITV
ncbi:hypothetical protein SND90_07670 [Escherichia coli]|nr:hypothetical protein [Escherichia coli]